MTEQNRLLAVLLTVAVLAAVLFGVDVVRQSLERQAGLETPPAANGQSDQQTAWLYYYNQARDLELGGGANPACSREAVLPVERTVAASNTIIEDTLRLLLQGNLTAEERAAGFTTEFPLPGLELVNTDLRNGTLILGFVDSEQRTVGGSCRVMLLWAQIAKTALQFPGVLEVGFQPAELFQP